MCLEALLITDRQVPWFRSCCLFLLFLFAHLLRVLVTRSTSMLMGKELLQQTEQADVH